MSTHDNRLEARASIGRPLFGSVCLLALLLASLTSSVFGHEYRLYIGTYSRGGNGGIYTCRFDASGGRFWSLELAAAAENPSYLTPDPPGGYLYAVNEVDSFQNHVAGAVSAYAIDRSTGTLSLIQQVSSLGAAPAHISMDNAARFIMVANYGGGSVAVFPIGKNGRLEPYSAFIRDTGSSVNPVRQAGPHAHFVQVTNDDKVAMVADLGADKIFLYAFDTGRGTLRPASPAYVSMDSGAGPRHLAFAPDGKTVYVLNELASTITILRYNPDRSAITKEESVPTLPREFSGANTAAEIAIDAGGKYLYASNRGDNSIVKFTVDQATGNLSDPAWTGSGGNDPRFFCIDPTGQWLLAANQSSDNVTLFQIDPQTGRLRALPEVLKVNSPVCIRFVRIN